MPATTSPADMHVFIAHSNDDKRMARELAEKLRARNIDVFFDEDSLPPGEDYDGRIRAAIGACRVFVFLASPSSIKPGVYALTELKIARRRWPNPTGRVLPVAVGGVTIDQLPPYLTQGVTVLSPMGNAVAETADEVERLLRSHGLGRHAKAALLGSAGVAVVALLGLGAAALADGPGTLPSTSVSSPVQNPSTTPSGSESSTPSVRDIDAELDALSSRPVPSSSDVRRPTSAEPAAASSPSIQPMPPRPPASSSPAVPPDFPLPTKIAKAGWKSVGAETFLPTSGWVQGTNQLDLEQSRATTELFKGKYRFSAEFYAIGFRSIEAPYRSAVDLFAAVDVNLVSSTVQQPEICLLFGVTTTQDYGFCVRKFPEGERLRLDRTNGSTVGVLIDWTPTHAKLENVNRMGVLVQRTHIQLFLNARLVGEHVATSFTGGKVALAVEANDVGNVVVDFDNFELRVPPE